MALTFLTSFVFFRLYFKDRIFPGISIAGNKVGNLSLAEASALLQLNSSFYLKSPLMIAFDEQEWRFFKGDVDLFYNYSSTLKDVYSFGREGPFLGILD